MNKSHAGSAPRASDMRVIETIYHDALVRKRYPRNTLHCGVAVNGSKRNNVSR